MIDEIIEFIRLNQISTTEVADCLGKSGNVPGLLPVNRGHFRVGKVKWTLAYDSSNWPVHKDIRNTRRDEIVFVDSWSCGDRAIVGELIAKYLLSYCHASALVCNGNIRDAASIIRGNYSVWCTGFNPVGCFNHEPSSAPDLSFVKARKEWIENSIAVCDDTGVVIIPREKHTTEFLDKLQAMKLQEEIWFDRLERCKEDTFEIVCEKKYLSTKK